MTLGVASSCTISFGFYKMLDVQLVLYILLLALGRKVGIKYVINCYVLLSCVCLLSASPFRLMLHSGFLKLCGLGLLAQVYALLSLIRLMMSLSVYQIIYVLLPAVWCSGSKHFLTLYVEQRPVST